MQGTDGSCPSDGGAPLDAQQMQRLEAPGSHSSPHKPHFNVGHSAFYSPHCTSPHTPPHAKGSGLDSLLEGAPSPLAGAAFALQRLCVR